jgi:hypothetical protein
MREYLGAGIGAGMILVARMLLGGRVIPPHPDDALIRYRVRFTDGTEEIIQATDLDEAWDWAEALSDGRTVTIVTAVGAHQSWRWR